MIPFKEIIKVAKALPRCSVTKMNESHLSYIVDRNGEKVGDINWDTGEIGIYMEYEYAEQVVEAIGKEKFVDVRKDLETKSEPITWENGEPSLTEQGRALYEEPSFIDPDHLDKITETTNK